MRETKGDRLGNGGILQKHLIYFAGRDLFAGAVNLLLQPAGDVQISVGIEKPLVARAKPTVGKGALVGLRVVLISGEHIRSLDHDLTPAIRSQVAAIAVHHTDANAGWGSNGTRFARSGGGQLG